MRHSSRIISELKSVPYLSETFQLCDSDRVLSFIFGNSTANRVALSRCDKRAGCSRRLQKKEPAKFTRNRAITRNAFQENHYLHKLV